MVNLMDDPSAIFITIITMKNLCSLNFLFKMSVSDICEDIARVAVICIVKHNWHRSGNDTTVDPIKC